MHYTYILTFKQLVHYFFGKRNNIYVDSYFFKSQSLSLNLLRKIMGGGGQHPLKLPLILNYYSQIRTIPI
jgi:hypothetical protein